MKQAIVYLYTFILLIILSACQQESPLPEQGTGYLQLDDLTQGNTTETIVTRAVETDLYIEITNEADVNLSYTPGQFPGGKLELAAGNYTLKAYNEAYLTPGSNAPRYYAEQDFTIEAEKVRYVTLQVPMINVAIKLAPFGDDLAGLFTNPTLTVKASTVTSEATTLGPDATVYFDYTEGMTFTYQLTATNTDNETFSTEEKTYGNTEGNTMEPGHCYVISYTLASSTRTLQDTWLCQ